MMYNIDVGLRASGAAIGLVVRIGGCGSRRRRVLSWTGGMYERFDEILAAHIGSSCTGGVGNTLVPLEALLITDVGGMVNRIGARVTPDFIVSTADTEACDDGAEDGAKHKATNARSNDDRGGYTRFPV